jgi:NO-binding membrane sensor protein with MHYT domain
VKSRATVELVLAAVAAVGCVVSWLAARSTGIAAPVVASEPSMPTVAYDPSLIVLAVALATIAGVLAVLGVTRLRRR